MTAYFNDSKLFFVLIILKFEFNNNSVAKVRIFLLTTKSFSHYFRISHQNKRGSRNEVYILLNTKRRFFVSADTKEPSRCDTDEHKEAQLQVKDARQFLRTGRTDLPSMRV